MSNVSDKSSRENWKTYFLEWVMFQTKVPEKVKKHFISPPQSVLYGIKWINTVEPDRPQMT
jgi:hypothetical protein